MLSASCTLFVPVFASASPFSQPSMLMCMEIDWRCTQGKLDFYVAWIRMCTELTVGFTSLSLWLFPHLIAAWHANRCEQPKQLHCLVNWHLLTLTDTYRQSQLLFWKLNARETGLRHKTEGDKLLQNWDCSWQTWSRRRMHQEISKTLCELLKIWGL
jgi:hypothetical protein